MDAQSSAPLQYSAQFAAPIVARYGSTSPEAPLIVLLHGRGSHELEIAALAQYLPTGPEYAAVRAPIAEGGGYAWFANRGIGRPVAESLAETMAWFRSWLDEVAPPGRPVVLVGFSGGAAFAGGLVLSDPQRFVGAAILLGTLPFDAGVRVEPGQLAHLPVMVAQGDDDQVIAAELLERTWSYLLEESGAPVVAVREAGGHAITATVVSELATWIATRLHHVAGREVTPVGLSGDAVWSTLVGGVLPVRAGLRPEVTWSIPQQQSTQNAPVDLQAAVFERATALGGVHVEPSQISVPGARAFALADSRGPDDAFLVPEVGEFAHLHPAYDGSLHLALPVDQAADVVAKGWGRLHMWAGTRLAPGFVLVFGPRTDGEVEVVAGIVAASHAYASGVQV